VVLPFADDNVVDVFGFATAVVVVLPQFCARFTLEPIWTPLFAMLTCISQDIMFGHGILMADGV
jgi:hypothetical protein